MEYKGHIPEKDLIEGLKSGSQRSFDQIYFIYAKRLYAFCLQYTKCHEDAEEIVQDVFVRLWKNRDRIKAETSLRTLLFVMSKRLLINAYRKRINSPVYEDYVNWTSAFPQVESSPPIEYDEFVKQVLAGIARLPRTQREVIRLSRFSCMSNKEIAQVLSLEEQTVKNQLSLGLKGLKVLLKLK